MNLSSGLRMQFDPINGLRIELPEELIEQSPYNEDKKLVRFTYEDSFEIKNLLEYNQLNKRDEQIKRLFSYVMGALDASLDPVDTTVKETFDIAYKEIFKDE